VEISSYGEFMLERRLEMLAESVVVYSDRLRKILSRISTPVSDSLLAIEGEDHGVASNYLDITDDKGLIGFIPDKKAEDLRKKIEEEGLRIFDGGLALNPLNDFHAQVMRGFGLDPGEFNTVAPAEGEMCKLVSQHVRKEDGSVWAVVEFPAGRAVVRHPFLSKPDKLYWESNRQSISVGRLARAVLKAAGREFTDAQVEEFVNKYKAAWDRSRDAFRNFEVVSGDDIAHWYWYGNYAPSNKGTLHNSCMSRKPDSFFEIYTQNPEVCSLLVLKSEEDEEKITGRALVWKTDQGFTFMDRVYTNYESDVQLFRDYAHSKGWHHKEANDSDYDMSTVGPEGQHEYSASVHIKANSYSKFPYMDTLKFLAEGRSAHILSNDEEGDWNKKLESTGGGSLGRCETCNDRGRVECGNCDGDGRVDCDGCEGDGEVECNECSGDGKEDCGTCDGTGEVDGDGDGETKSCPDCDATGRVDCSSCGGNGVEECGDCGGSGSVRCSHCDGECEVDCPECT
jgi:hypothetical protein